MISRLIPAFTVVIEKGDTTEVRIVVHTYPSLYDMGVVRKYAWEILNTITQGFHVKPVEVMDVDYMNSPKSSSLGWSGTATPLIELATLKVELRPYLSH